MESLHKPHEAMLQRRLFAITPAHLRSSISRISKRNILRGRKECEVTARSASEGLTTGMASSARMSARHVLGAGGLGDLACREIFQAVDGAGEAANNMTRVRRTAEQVVSACS
ncbi:uncharacterized protein RHO17_022862 [Thomomys bottae]